MICYFLASGINDVLLAEFAISKGANEFNKAITYAAANDYLKIVKFLVSKGADNFNWAMNLAHPSDLIRNLLDFLCPSEILKLLFFSNHKSLSVHHQLNILYPHKYIKIPE